MRNVGLKPTRWKKIFQESDRLLQKQEEGAHEKMYSSHDFKKMSDGSLVRYNFHFAVNIP